MGMGGHVSLPNMGALLFVYDFYFRGFLCHEIESIFGNMNYYNIIDKWNYRNSIVC